MRVDATESAIVVLDDGSVKAYPVCLVGRTYTNPASLALGTENPFRQRARGLPLWRSGEGNKEEIGEVVEIISARRERGAVTRWTKVMKKRVKAKGEVSK